MKYERVDCTCGSKMSVPNYMGGNGAKEMWWCRNCGRIRFKDWSGKWKSLKPKQSENLDMLRRMFQWGEQMYYRWRNKSIASLPCEINMTTLDNVRAYLKKQGDLI